MFHTKEFLPVKSNKAKKCEISRYILVSKLYKKRNDSRNSLVNTVVPLNNPFFAQVTDQKIPKNSTILDCVN